MVSHKKDYVCLAISKNKWSNTCKFSPKAFDDVDEGLLGAMVKHLRKRGILASWLPIERLDTFGPLLWTIPGPHWSSRLSASGRFEITYGNRDMRCVVLDVDHGLRIRAESCAGDYPYLCIVEKDYFTRGACPRMYYASPTPEDKRCFRLVKRERLDWQKATSGCSTAQIDGPLVQQLFSGLGRRADLKDTDFCWIRGDGRYRSNTMAMSVAGETRNMNTSVVLNCVFCQMDTPTHPETSISLTFHPNDRELLLSVYGEEGLLKVSSSDPGIRCFTNANGDLIRNVKIRKIWDKRWTAKDVEPYIDFEDRVDLDFDIHKTVYRAKISSKRPGYYVCEGHTVGGKLLTTKRVIAYEELEGNIFALGLEVMNACQSVEKCDPTFAKVYQKLAEDLESSTTDRLVEDIRTMQILDITTDGNVTLLFHVTAKKFDHEEFDADSVKNAFMRSKRLFQLLAAVHHNIYRFVFLHSCDGCLASVTGRDETRLVWPYTKVGMTAVSEEICVDARGIPVHRICKGNFMRGGAWSDPSGNCVGKVSQSTMKLYKIGKDIRDSRLEYDRRLKNEVLSIVESMDEATVADIYLLSKIIDYEVNVSNSTDFSLEDVTRVASMLDRMMRTNETTLKQARVFNSTDILLDSLETLLNFVSGNISTEYLYENEGVISAVTDYLVIYILDPNVTDISGIALIKNATNGTLGPRSFLDYDIVPLSADLTIDDVGGLGDVEVATWLPRNLLDTILKPNYTSLNESLWNVTDQSPRIVVTLFYNDVVFASELAGQNISEVNSKVVSVSVPGFGTNLPSLIPLLFKPTKRNSQDTKTCAFWDFDYVGVSASASLSAWSEDGCQNSGRTRDQSGELIVCLCSHMTHFAQLVLGHFPGPEESKDPVSIQHGEALELITVIGCVLSMLGVFGILITAMVFKIWRKKPGSKVLIQLSLALGLEKFMIGVLPLVDSAAYPIPCIVSGAVLHYSVLAEFSWMLVTAWLQFKRYVTILGATRPPRFLLKAGLFAWGVPLAIVTTVVSIDPNIYLPETGSTRGYCQVSGITQYVSLLGPVMLIICLNAILFIRVIYSIFEAGGRGPKLKDDKSLLFAQLRLGIMLFFLLGITWVFGFIAKMGGGLIFSYLFSITAALQGFVLFMFFIICDPVTRNLWNSLANVMVKSSKSNTTLSVSAISVDSEYIANDIKNSSTL